ncbi:MAG: hypothetical protein ABI067_10295 [Leifsonia sp.]
MQTPNPLGADISAIGQNMFGNGAAVALRRMQIQGLQRENYGITGLADEFGNSQGGVVDPQQAARLGVLGGLGPDKIAGYSRYLAAVNTGPRSDLTTNANAAAGDYDKSAENLDLNRANAVNMGAARNATSTANTNTRVGGLEKIASMKAALDQWKFGNKPVAGVIDGKPGFVRQADPALGAIIEPGQPTQTPFAAKTSAVESGNSPTAQNPNSSATGNQQFTDGTWMDVLAKHAPELLQGRTPQQALALRDDPKLSDAMATKYGDDNATVLKSQGLPVTDGTKYLAHILGPGGAVKALKSDPNASLTSILSPEAIQANPQLAGMTAGGARAWADKKMGVAAAPQGQPAAQIAPIDQTVAQPVPQAQPAQAQPAHTVTPMLKGPQALAGLPMPDPVRPGPDGKVDPAAKAAYLAKLSPADQADVLGLVNGTKLPEQIQLQGGARSRAVNLASGYDGNYSAPVGKARAALTQSEMGGGPVGKAMTALDQGTGHMKDYITAAGGLHDLGWSQLNHIYNAVMGQNTDANTATNAALAPMSSEIETIFRQSPGAQEGIKQIMNSLNVDMPQSARASAMATLGGMMKDRVKSYADQHLAAFGNLDNFPIPDVREKLKALGVDTKDLDPIYAAAKNHGGMNTDKLPGGSADPALATAGADASGWKLAPDGKTKIRLKQ